MILLSGSEQNTSEEFVAQPITLSIKKKSRIVKAKGQKKTVSIVEIFMKIDGGTSDSISVLQVFTESEQPIKALHITYVPFRFGSSSKVLQALCLTGVIIREPLP